MSKETMVPHSRILREDLEDWLKKVFVLVGMTPGEAGMTAYALSEADLRGVYSHGSVRLPEYIGLLRRGVWVSGAQPKVLIDFGSLSLLDGCHGVGPCIAMSTMERAMAIAHDYGAGWVWVRNSGHFGAAATYTIKAAREGFIGLAFSNASPVMAPWGGRMAVLGNNPWSIAVPADEGAWPIVLDLANTVVARGKIRAARDRGESIPEGWALDPEGRPTTDPTVALRGTLLPFGGYKGYGISFMMEVLTSVVAGAAIAREVASPRDGAVHQRLGQAFVAIDTDRMNPLDDFRSRVTQLVRYMKESERGPGADRILVPGEREALIAEEQERIGILLPAEVRAAIIKVARDLSLTPPI